MIVATADNKTYVVPCKPVGRHCAGVIDRHTGSSRLQVGSPQNPIRESHFLVINGPSTSCGFGKEVDAQLAMLEFVETVEDWDPVWSRHLRQNPDHVRWIVFRPVERRQGREA